MPIYEYRCSSCSHELESLQKFSDPLLTLCPSCGTDALVKKISAAGFHLKGTGWYATDFKGGSKPSSGKDSTGSGKDSTDKSAAKTDGKGEKAETKSETKSEAAPAACGTGGCGACS